MNVIKSIHKKCTNINIRWILKEDLTDCKIVYVKSTERY